MNLKILLQPKQADLLALLETTGPDVATILGAGGSRGSAKSGGLRRIAITLAITHPGSVIYIVRRTLGDLLENHMEKIALEFPEVDAIYRPSDYEYDFSVVPNLLPNGERNRSRIVFVYAENAIDVARVSYGPECTFLLIDQAEQFTEEELTSFRICNRHTEVDPKKTVPPNFAKTCYFFNIGVGGLADAYFRRVFHKRDFKPYKGINDPGERPGDYAFIQMYGWDNFEWFRGQVEVAVEEFYQLSSAERFEMFVTRTSEGRKMNALPKHRREGELLGNFDAFTGQYFSDVWDDARILPVELVNRIVQDWWVRWMGQDWAFHEHAYHCWMVTGKVSPADWFRYFGVETEWPVDVVILYRELLISGRAEMDLANDIAEMTPERERKYISNFYLSEDAFGKRSRQRGANTVGEAFSGVMRRHGLPAPTTADQDRVNGHRFMYNCLRQASMRIMRVDVERAKQGPALFISANCPAAIENIPLAPRDPENPDDVLRVAGVVWEDVVDGIRYALKSKLSPRRIVPSEVRRQEVFNQAAGNPTGQALAMRQFEEAERRRGNVTRPNWRNA